MVSADRGLNLRATAATIDAIYNLVAGCSSSHEYRQRWIISTSHPWLELCNSTRNSGRDGLHIRGCKARH